MASSPVDESYEKLRRYYAATGFRLSLPLFIAIIIFVSLLSSVLIIFIFDNWLFAFVAFVAINSLVFSVPLYVRSSRISSVEENLPDALKHMSSILRSGGTTEDALEEVANSDYGPLSDDLRRGLRQLNEGKTFDDVLSGVAADSGSILFSRISFIIIDARRAGAGLADVMDAIAEDAKDLSRIKRERLSRTTMPVLFLMASSLLLAPFIFGFTFSIVCFMSAGMTGLESGAPQQVSFPGIDIIGFHFTIKELLMSFVGVQGVIALLAMGAIRESKFLKYVIYIPFAVLFAYLIYIGGSSFGYSLVGGGMSC